MGMCGFAPRRALFSPARASKAGAAARRYYSNLSQVAKWGVLRLKQRGISNIVVTDSNLIWSFREMFS